ncbi:MAG: FAD:protein FMN transferase [Sediminibacterium sp.]
MDIFIVKCNKNQLKKYSFQQTKMGSPFNIILVADDPSRAAELAGQAFALVDAFNLVYSDYDPLSELNRLNNNAGAGPQPISQALLDILLLSQEAYRKSNGTYDISVGPLSLLWRNARKEKMFPDSAAVAAGKELVGLWRMQIDREKRTADLPLAGMRLDLGGIAKGYIAQKVVDFLRSEGIDHALADAGGDMVMGDAPPGSMGWVIGVNVPETTAHLLPRRLLLQNMAVATSGDAFQYFEHNRRRYSHIIDAGTGYGYGITGQRNVTIIAAEGTTAEWLATACSILPVETAKQLANANGAELLITVLKQEKIVYHATSGFADYWRT